LHRDVDESEMPAHIRKDGDGVTDVEERSLLKAAWGLVAKHLGFASTEKGSDGDMADTKQDLEKVMESLDDDARALVRGELQKRDEKIASLEKRVAELEKKGTKGENTEKDGDIQKADLPEEIRKRFEDLERRAKEAEEVAKAEREARIKAEIRKRAEGYAKVGPVDELADLMYKAQDVSKEFAEKLESVLKTAHERIEKGALFGEIGGPGGDAPDTAWGKIERLADEIQKADAKLTRAEAITKAIEANPELEHEYAEEVRQ